MMSKLIKVLSVACVLALLAAAGVGSWPFARAEQEGVGDAEINTIVRNLEIEWTSGTVRIAYHSGDTVVISEKASGAISEDRRMRWTLEGDTLHIRYEKPGFRLFSFLSPTKELTVTLPEGVSLQNARIATASADMVISALYAENVRLETASGDIRAEASVRTVQCNTTSGDMELLVNSAADEVLLRSISGRIRAAVYQAGKFQAKTTSGDVHAFIGVAKKTGIESVSGKVVVEISAMEALEIKTVSGDVTAYLPETPGFSARIETISGRVENTLPLTRQGKDYTAGDGSGTVTIHTISGDVALCGKKD